MKAPAGGDLAREANGLLASVRPGSPFAIPMSTVSTGQHGAAHQHHEDGHSQPNVLILNRYLPSANFVRANWY